VRNKIKKSVKDTERNYWHEPFYQAFRKELEQYKNDLKFLEEVKINADALFADLIVIKKKQNVRIKKSIAKAFKTYNIVEYKSPKDNLDVRTLQKAFAYAALYAFNKKIDFDDITVTLIGNKHPRELLNYLKKRFTVKERESGIYEASGGLFLLQIIETKRLDRVSNRFLYGLGNKLDANELKETLASGLTDEGLKGYIDLLVKENLKTYKEITVMVTDKMVYDVLKNSPIGKKIIEEAIIEGEKRGIKKGLEMAARQKPKKKTAAARGA